MSETKKLEEYVVDIDGDVFACLRKDINTILRRLLSNMESKGSENGEITVKIEVAARNDSIPDIKSPDGSYRDIVRPEFKHTVSSTMKIQDKETGKFSGEYELIWDKETCRWITRRIDDGQMTLDDIVEGDTADTEQKELADNVAGFLPGGSTDSEVIEADFREIDDEEQDGDLEYDEPEEGSENNETDSEG